MVDDWDLDSFMTEFAVSHKKITKKGQRADLLGKWSVAFSSGGAKADWFYTFANGVSNHNRAFGKDAVRKFREINIESFFVYLWGRLVWIEPKRSSRVASAIITMLEVEGHDAFVWDENLEWCYFVHHAEGTAFAYT